MKKIIVALVISLMTLDSYAEEKTAEELVASKIKADITYRQLMEVMGSASSMMHEGIIRENKQMVKEGANIILNHPAPKHKPWIIMNKSDQEEFKKSLLAYDKILDLHAAEAAKQAEKNHWVQANKALNELSTSCISCHAMWKDKVK